MTKQALTERIAAHPAAGTVVPRAQMSLLNETGASNGYRYHVTTDYRVLGPYRPDQPIEVLGLLVTVWSRARVQTVSGPLAPNAVLDDVVADLGAKADALCQHPNGGSGPAIDCPDCGAKFRYDTSD